VAGEEYPPFLTARDSLIPLAANAAVTESIRLCTEVLHTWTQNVLTLAITFASFWSPIPCYARIVLKVGGTNGSLSWQCGINGSSRRMAGQSNGKGKPWEVRR
jgi:hypothetical protein